MYLEKAQRLLEELRKGSRDHQKKTRELYEALSQAGVGLADIGTSEQELQTLAQKGRRLAAEAFLGKLRQSTNVEAFRDYYIHLSSEMKKGDLQLADIGSSEEEIDNLMQKLLPKTARDYLDLLRSKPSDLFAVDYIYNNFIELLAQGLTLEMLGTSEEELDELLSSLGTMRLKKVFNSLRKRPDDSPSDFWARAWLKGVCLMGYYTMAGKRYLLGRPSRYRAILELARLRDGIPSIENLFVRFFHNLFMANLTLERVGTNRDELLDLIYEKSAIAVQTILFLLQQGSHDPRLLIKHLQLYLRLGNFQLSDFGSSEEKLKELTSLYYQKREEDKRLAKLKQQEGR